MFAGIIARVCKIMAVRPAPDAVRLEVELGDLLDGIALGASVAINGACLTLAERRERVGGFDVVPETWRLTSLNTLAAGDFVNAERSLRVGDRIDGHFVQGHVDGLGRLERVDRVAGEYKLWITAPAELMPYIVRKGSIALDGISLTVVDVKGDSFSVALIPTTLNETAMSFRRPGDAINIETDILARIVLSRLAALTGGAASPGNSGLTWERLQQSGFAP